MPLFLTAQNELLFSQANEAYNKGNYTKAVELYENIEKTGNVSENLYFNLANSYYKLQKIAPSIYNYEKALSLAPNNQDILDNYRFAKNMRIDQIDQIPQGFLDQTVFKHSKFMVCGHLGLDIYYFYLLVCNHFCAFL